jgi:chaperone LolA
MVLGLGVAFASPAAPGSAAPASAGASVAAADVKVIVSKVEAKYAKVSTIQASFTQVKKDSFGQVQQDGDVTLQRPTRMRWRFTTGDQSEFVTDGSVLWIYTKADNQVLRINDTSQAAGTANTFLTSLDSLDEMFVVTLVENEGGPTLMLVPRKPGMYKSIRLGLDAALVLERVVFVDTYDNVTDIAFRDVKLDGTVDPKVFQFQVPAGVKVIDN